MTKDEKRRKEEGWPDRLFEAVGRLATVRRPIKTGIMEIPVGAAIEITNGTTGWNRISIAGQPCDHCGVRIRASRIAWTDLDILPPTEVEGA